MIALAGGWGYNNLGDEAILAGYRRYLKSRGRESVVYSVNPERTRRAQGDAEVVVSEGASPAHATILMLAGGGYLNGNWSREIGLKLLRLRLLRGNRPMIAHGIEARALNSRMTARLSSGLLRGATISVRDPSSVRELRLLGIEDVAVTSDGIALLYPHLGAYVRPIAHLHGRVLLNLLDISQRSDSHESEVPLEDWMLFCKDLVQDLGPRAVGLIVGGGDYRFMRKLPAMPLVTPTTVSDLVSVIASCDALFSVRMHPMLIASMLSKPVVAVPYCGKVRPTLSRIGIEDHILTSLTLEAIHKSWAMGKDDDSKSWNRACKEAGSWLDAALSGVAKGD